MFFDRLVLHTVGAALGIVVLASILIGSAHLDQWVRPPEITHVPRHAADPATKQVLTAVVPGQVILVGGEYETLREGCQARFERSVEWEHNEFGPITNTTVHSGSFDVNKPQRRWARRIVVVPEEARPGTEYISRISNAWFDCTGLPFGLGRVQREYAEIRLKIQ